MFAGANRGTEALLCWSACSFLLHTIAHINIKPQWLTQTQSVFDGSQAVNNHHNSDHYVQPYRCPPVCLSVCVCVWEYTGCLGACVRMCSLNLQNTLSKGGSAKGKSVASGDILAKHWLPSGTRAFNKKSFKNFTLIWPICMRRRKCPSLNFKSDAVFKTDRPGLHLWSWPRLWCSKGANCNQPGGENPHHLQSGGGKRVKEKLSSRLSRCALFSLVFCLMYSRERQRRDGVRLRGRGREKERGCVRVHEGEIHYSDNESIWDNMRQFTSPVVVSSIQGEDTFPAQSQRTSSSAAASLACLPTDAAAVQSTIQEHRRVCLLRSFALSAGLCCFCSLVKACSVHSQGFIVTVARAKTGSDKSRFLVKATYGSLTKSCPFWLFTLENVNRYWNIWWVLTIQLFRE